MVYTENQPAEDSGLILKEDKRWYKPQTKREKCCLITMVVIVVLFLIFLIATIALAIRKKNDSSSITNDVCLTSQCLTSAASLLNAMNRTLDPCEDFYSYSCGNWIKDHQIRENPSENQFSDLQDIIYSQLRDILDNSRVKNSSKVVKYGVNLYRSCLNSRNTNITGNFFQILNDIGGWPIQNKTWKKSENFYKNIAKAITLLKVEPLFQLNVKPDDKNTSINIISISQPEHLEISDLIKFIEIILNENTTEIKDDLLQIEKLDQIIQNAKENHSKVEKLTIRSLNNLTNSNYWLDIIHTVMNDNWVQLNITEEEIIQVDNVDYLINLIKEINENNIDERTVANYIGAYAAYIFFTRIGIFQISPSEEVQPWKPCLSLSLKCMPLAMDHIYTGNKNISEAYADEMIKYLKVAFKQLASKATWLDDQTREAAYDKLEAMIQFSGYSPIVLNITALEEYYEHLEEITDEDVLLNLRKLIKFVIAKQFSVLREYNSRSNWLTEISATTVNAFYNPLQNSITFPAAIQNLPFYDLNRPWYLNFGAIGAVIGHEITHGFDNQGSQRDKYGNLYDWWSPDTKKKFQEKSKCFVDQYNNYKLDEINENVNGTRTLGENIADNGGLRQSYQAYQDWEKKYGKEKLLPGLDFDSSQLFFLSFANIWCSIYSPDAMRNLNMKDEHSIGKYRVIGTLSNMEEFSKAFNCKKGSKMNPKNKCVIW